MGSARNLYLRSNLINSTLVDGGDTARCDKYVWNPLSVDPVASQFSSYAAVQDTTVVRPLVPGVPVDAELIDAHDQLPQSTASWRVAPVLGNPLVQFNAGALIRFDA